MWAENTQPNTMPAFSRELLRSEPHDRRHGRDPVQPVEHCKQRQAVERERRLGESDERETAQSVLYEQKRTIVIAVAEPSRADRADEIAQPDDGEHNHSQAC